MGQDLRELLQNNLKNPQAVELSDTHELRFLDKLNNTYPEDATSIGSEKKSFLNKFDVLSFPTKVTYKKWLSIAASLTISVGLGAYFLKQTQELQHNQKSVVHIDKQADNLPSLADVSPEFKQIEDGYLTTINVGLSELKVNDSNRGVVRGGIEQLKGLKEEYQSILKNLRSETASPQTIRVLIENLEMQLLLLKQLKQKVKNINEYSPSNAYQNLQT